MQTILFFDLDATIMVNPFDTAVFPFLMDEFTAHTGQSGDVFWHAMVTENRRRQLAKPNHPLTMDWDDIVECFGREQGVTFSKRVIDLVEANCTPEHIAILDEADTVLKLLKPDYQLVVATKGLGKYQIPVMKALGLDELFDDFLSPDVTGYLKTEPEFFSKHTNSREGKQFVQIGDHHYDDVICAKRNDFYSVMRVPIAELASIDPLKRPQHLHRYADQIPTYQPDQADILPDAVITHHSELPSVLKRL